MYDLVVIMGFKALEYTLFKELGSSIDFEILFFNL